MPLDHPVNIAMATAFALIVVSCAKSAAAFAVPPAFGKTASMFSSSITTSLSSSSPSENGNPTTMPFFAAPFFAADPAAASPASSSGQPPPQSAATVTLRLPLGTLFDGRDYVFVTESNVRGYEWTTKEADILMDDLTDAALGNMGVEGSSSAPSSPLLADYELSQIVLVPTADWDSSRLGLGNRYDVYDGQQRLVTLNLLLAGLRDSFRREADELSANDKEGTGGGKRAVALAATAQEISGMLMPARVRKEDVARMTLRRRDNVLLEKIAIGDTDGDDSGGEGSSSSSPPVRDYSGMSARQRSDLLSPLSSANARIFHNFVHLLDRLASLTTRERLRLLDYIVERVHLLVCIPETSRVSFLYHWLFAERGGP